MRARLALGAVLAVIAVACSNNAGGGGADAAERASARAVRQVKSTPREHTISALENPTAGGLPKPLVDPSDLISGGPPPDGIPALDDPKFLAARDVRFLKNREPVLAVKVGGEDRAYPVQVLTWHEIVNDTIGGKPVTISYCPLCNSAIAFDRRSGDRVLDFGTSGMLYQSALVMYDRQTKSLWTQFTGQAVAGALTGTQLATIPVATVSWGDWRLAHPRGLVLSRDTGFDRPYGRNPYPGYDDVQSPPFVSAGKADRRLAAKEHVVGIRAEGDPVAIVTKGLGKQRVFELSAAGRELVVWLKPGTASGLDAGNVAGGRDIGATGVFDRVLDGRTLTFVPTGAGFADRDTGSAWNVLGTATDGPLAGKTLTPIEHVDTFWFAWAAYLPQTRIVAP